MNFSERIAEQRENARMHFERLALPTAKDENFRYTVLPSLNIEATTTKEASPFPTDRLLQIKEEAALCQSTSRAQSFAGAEERVVWSTWDGLPDSQMERVQEILKTERLQEDKFAALAQAEWRVGSILIVPKGVHIELPLRFSLWANEKFTAYKNLVILEEGSRLTYVEELGSDSNLKSLVVGLTEFTIEKDAHLEYFQAQSFASDTDFFLRQSFTVAKDAELKIIPAHVGAHQGQVRMEVELSGENAKVECQGAVRIRGEQHVDIWIENKHVSGKTKSEMQFFYVLADEARAVFNGTIKIPATALGCESSQKHKTLLLSTKASVHTMPKLEIATDEVKCSHGASVSSVQAEQLYYLESRGISEAEAERMIVTGFTEPVLQRLPGEQLRQRLNTALGVHAGILLQ